MDMGPMDVPEEHRLACHLFDEIEGVPIGGRLRIAGFLLGAVIADVDDVAARRGILKAMPALVEELVGKLLEDSAEARRALH